MHLSEDTRVCIALLKELPRTNCKSDLMTRNFYDCLGVEHYLRSEGCDWWPQF